MNTYGFAVSFVLYYEIVLWGFEQYLMFLMNFWKDIPGFLFPFCFFYDLSKQMRGVESSATSSINVSFLN